MGVTARWVEGMVVRTRDGQGPAAHELVGDEPASLGGTDFGFNPFALFQASLANCTIVTVVGEAELQGIPLEGIEVEVSHRQNRVVGGPRDPEQRGLRITGLRRTVRVAGPLDDDQLARLHWAAEHCPVSNSLEGAIPIRTETVRAAPPV